MSSKYPSVESILSCVLNHFHRRVTKRLGMCRVFNVLAKHNGTYDKALLHGNGEMPEKGDLGSEIQPVGTYRGWQAEDSQPWIHACKWSLIAALCYATTLCIGFALKHHRIALCFQSSPSTHQCPTLCRASRECLCC